MVYVDRLLDCCGLGGAYGFYPYPPNRIKPAGESTGQQLNRAADDAWRDSRNCVLITLSSDQTSVIEEAKARGYKIVHEFYNPNSGNQVYILTYTKYESKEAFMESEDYIEDEEEEENW